MTGKAVAVVFLATLAFWAWAAPFALDSGSCSPAGEARSGLRPASPYWGEASNTKLTIVSSEKE
jgi:hypothetical protein